MTNTVIEAGDRSVEEMIGDIERGVYAVGMLVKPMGKCLLLRRHLVKRFVMVRLFPTPYGVGTLDVIPILKSHAMLDQDFNY